MPFDAQTVFRDVADLSPAERQRYFEQESVPPEIRAEVESLLDYDSDDDAPLDLVSSEAAQFLESAASLAAGGRCGHYVLVRLLGEGGMGSVFLARRDDGEVDQQVAIKFVLHGGLAQSFLKRFLDERRILASLSHPGIARLLDAGHTTGGLPYLVSTLR